MIYYVLLVLGFLLFVVYPIAYIVSCWKRANYINKLRKTDPDLAHQLAMEELFQQNNFNNLMKGGKR